MIVHTYLTKVSAAKVARVLSRRHSGELLRSPCVARALGAAKRNARSVEQRKSVKRRLHMEEQQQAKLAKAKLKVGRATRKATSAKGIQVKLHRAKRKAGKYLTHTPNPNTNSRPDPNPNPSM